MSSNFTESTVESAALAWLESLEWSILHGPDIAPDTIAAERTDYNQVVIERRLKDALARLNPALPTEAIDDAYRKLTRPKGPSLEARNRALHRLLVDGVTVEYRKKDGAIRGAQARVIDFDDVENNDFLAVNQFTVVENKHNRRIGVVWHTQGSGKSLTMSFYAGRIIREPGMENPTIVVITDRDDLRAKLAVD